MNKGKWYRMIEIVIPVIVGFFLMTPTCLFSDWGSDVRISNDASYSWVSYNNAWCVGANGSNIHVVWFDFRDGNHEIYYKRSTDGGSNWGSETRLTNADSSSLHPCVAVLDSSVHQCG